MDPGESPFPTPFFEPPAPPPEDEPAPGPAPGWLGPPPNVLGVPLDLELALARTEEVAVAVTGAVAFPSGLAFLLCVRRRTPREGGLGDVWARAGGGALPDDLVRVGVLLSDGRRATTVDPHPDPAGDAPGAVLCPRAGTGDGLRAWDQSYWLWPLPPPGALTFVCEWPAEGIGITTTPVDAAPIVDAAARATVLWEDIPPKGAWTAY